MTDARFEDGAEQPLRLFAHDTDDLVVISALVQDAIFPSVEMAWHPRQRRFAILLNRFRWEDRDAAAQAGRKFERVRSVLEINDVTHVRSQGFARSAQDLVLSVLSIQFDAQDDGMGEILLTLAGDGLVALQVECLNISLVDVTRPYIAPSGQTPNHPA